MQGKNSGNTNYGSKLIIRYVVWPEIYKNKCFRDVLLVVCNVIVVPAIGVGNHDFF